MNVFNEPAWNVICVKEGTEFPDEYIIIGAHYDSYSSNDYDYPAPGADDNASGCAAFLEFARLFKDYDFRHSLIFVGWGAEEQMMDGSIYMAEQMYADGVDIKLVANYDVISYEGDGIYQYNISQMGQKAYAQVFIDALDRLGLDLETHPSNWPLDDDASFADLGYQTTAFFEWEYHPLMHTAYDLATSVDFEYMRQIIMLGATAFPIIDAAPNPIVSNVYDVGDGSTLKLIWEDCHTDWIYTIIYGTNRDHLTDTIQLSSSNCEYDITGLTQNLTYYFALTGLPPDGYPTIGYNLVSMRPASKPRVPANFTADIGMNYIELGWEPNIELDFNHYKILRKLADDPTWAVLENNYEGIQYYDYSAQKYIDNQYCILAVDNDSNESDSSEIVYGMPASLDAGLLFIDETQDVNGLPSEYNQNAFYSAILDTFSYMSYILDEGEYLTRSTAGQYNPLFWVDDDSVHNELAASWDSLAWYLNLNTDFLLAGWKTIYSMTGQTYFYPGDLFYDQFGITYIAENSNLDFAGATGLNGWPDLEINTALVPLGRMSNINRFAVNNKAEVILTFNSSTGNPAYANKPVGVAYDSRHGKRILLGFPLYYLTEASAKAFIEKAMSYFAEESIVYYGDVNDDWNVNILDITYLITFLYQGGPAPIIMNNGDPNASCNINILDITDLIGYL
ncbi:MAG: M20/M25/M40 family metallo-hydrolase, partial [Candidatus Zixiibacteriota bacterium]